jgi:NADP-dependent 3-hydroxy acid dehydrogenase YdfG
MGGLEGKIAVITGAKCGIGLASAKRFVKEGAQVYITGRRQEELDKALQTIGPGVTAVQDDVSDARRRQVSFWPSAAVILDLLRHGSYRGPACPRRVRWAGLSTPAAD